MRKEGEIKEKRGRDKGEKREGENMSIREFM